MYNNIHYIIITKVLFLVIVLFINLLMCHHGNVPLPPDTGATVQTAVKVLKDHGVLESNVVFVNLFSSHRGTNRL